MARKSNPKDFIQKEKKPLVNSVKINSEPNKLIETSESLIEADTGNKAWDALNKILKNGDSVPYSFKITLDNETLIEAKECLQGTLEKYKIESQNPDQPLLGYLLTDDFVLVDESKANKPNVIQHITGDYIEFVSRITLKIPDDSLNILQTPQECLQILEDITPLADLVLGFEFTYDKDFICDTLIELEDCDRLTGDKLTTEIRYKTAYLLTKTAVLVNHFLIKDQFNLTDFKELIKSTFKGTKLEIKTQININDISSILKDINLIFPELKIDLTKEYQPRALVNDLNRMANLPVITSGVKALRDRQWNKDDLGNACYTHRKADNSDSYITHYIRDFNDDEEIASLPHSEAIQILEKFGVYPALLHLILAVHFYKQPDPTTAILRLKGTDLIKDLGLDKRKDLTREQKLERVYETITAVRSLLIKAKWTITLRGRKKPVNVYFDPYVMWDILPVKITETDLFGKESLIEIEIKARAGLWLDEFLSKVGKGSSKVFYSYATLSQKILDLDPYHEELALRIALLQSTMDYRQYYTVEQWLIENLLGAKTKISEAKSDRIKRKKLVDLWDNTLKALERIGFKIHFDNKTYPEEFRPYFEGKKPRGYFDRLLEAKIKLTPESLGKPESDQDVIEAEKIPITPEKAYRGEDLKKARLKANISPKQIAKCLECSQGKIYNAEKRENISEALFKEIMSAIRSIIKYPDKYPKY